MGKLIYRDSRIEITDELIRVGTVIHAISHISEVKLRTTPRAAFGAILFGFGMVVAILAAIFVYVRILSSLFMTEAIAGLLVLGIAGLIMRAAFALLQPRYGLVVTTVSGDETVLKDSSDAYLAKIRGEILRAVRAAGLAAADQPIAPATPRDTIACPECAETIKAAARICRFCRHRLVPAEN